jgi:general secretion pathway protein D
MAIIGNAEGPREKKMLGGRVRLFCCLSLGLIFLVGCGAGNVAFREARKAELRKDWDTALVNYQKALELEPENAKYLIHEKLVRAQAAAFHLKQGRRLLGEGRQDQAAGEFQKAVSIDPTNEAAAQELARLLAAQAAAKKAREAALKQALKPSEETAVGGIVKLKALSQEPMAKFQITGDSRKVFEMLAKMAGLNVAFTSDFAPKPITVSLTNIKIEDALRLISLQTKSFWRPVTPNTILVVPDSVNNRRDYDVTILKTIYLSNPLAAADRSAITNAIKQVLGLRNIVENPDSNAIIIRDTPDNIAAAEELIRDLDRGKAEIMIDVSVIEADRDRARDLGLYPATITSSGSITPGIQGAAVYVPTVAATSTSSTTTAAAAAATGLHLSTHDYSVAVPSVAANAILNDTRTHILENPQVRVTDGSKATLKVGSRIPYATGSFLPSLGGVATSGTTYGLLGTTQFQFQDVGVNLELTPHLLADGEVAIHAVIEILSLGANVTIGGIQEPTFGQRKIEHDIRLKEDEVSVLGGLIQSTMTRSRSGTPFLGEIPLLGDLFSTEHLERNDTEVLVMLTPRVVRLPEPALTAGSSVAVGGGVPSGSEATPVPEATPPVPMGPSGPPRPAGPPGAPGPPGLLQ